MTCPPSSIVFSLAFILLAANSGSAVLVKQAPSPLGLARLELGQNVELGGSLADANLLTVSRELRKRYNTSDEWVTSVAKGMIEQFKHKPGAEDGLANLARSIPSVTSNKKLQAAVQLAQSRLAGAAGASIKQLVELSAGALTETGAAQELKSIARASASTRACLGIYCPDSVQAGITLQGAFPIDIPNEDIGWLLDIFVVIKPDSEEKEKICISPRIGMSDKYSERFSQFGATLFVGGTNWQSQVEGSNLWTWGAMAGPRVWGGSVLGKELNFLSAEISWSMVHKGAQDTKLIICLWAPEVCSESTYLGWYATLFAEATLCK